MSVLCTATVRHRIRLRERMDVSWSSACGLLCWAISAVDVNHRSDYGVFFSSILASNWQLQHYEDFSGQEQVSK